MCYNYSTWAPSGGGTYIDLQHTVFKIKGTLKKNEDVKLSGSDHPQGISAPSFRTAPL